MELAEAFSYCHTSAIPADFPADFIPMCFTDLFRQAGDLSLLRPLVTIYTSTGILTSYPSTFPFGYVLGPD